MTGKGERDQAEVGPPAAVGAEPTLARGASRHGFPCPECLRQAAHWRTASRRKSPPGSSALRRASRSAILSSATVDPFPEIGLTTLMESHGGFFVKPELLHHASGLYLPLARLHLPSTLPSPTLRKPYRARRCLAAWQAVNYARAIWPLFALRLVCSDGRR
jgi:hypothetical protein